MVLATGFELAGCVGATLDCGALAMLGAAVGATGATTGFAIGVAGLGVICSACGALAKPDLLWGGKFHETYLYEEPLVVCLAITIVEIANNIEPINDFFHPASDRLFTIKGFCFIAHLK